MLFFVYGGYRLGYEDVFVLTMQIVIITIFIPITFYYLLLSLRKVDSIMLSETSQRRIPLVVHSILLVVMLKRTIPLEVYPELHFFFLGCLVSTVAALVLVLLRIKASLHMIGVSALAIFAIAISLHVQERLILPIVVILMCNGLVATSRLYMKAHSHLELLLGTGIGVIPQLMLLYFWL